MTRRKLVADLRPSCLTQEHLDNRLVALGGRQHDLVHVGWINATVVGGATLKFDLKKTADYRKCCRMVMRIDEETLEYV